MSDFHTEKPVAMLPKYYFYRVIVVRLRLITDDNAEHMLDIYGVICLMKAFFFFFENVPIITIIIAMVMNMVLLDSR